MNLNELEAASGGMVRQTKYLKKNPARQYLIGQYLRAIEAFANRTPARKVLDVGCGEGFVLRHLAEHRNNFALAGLDVRPDVLKVAAYQNPDAQLFVGDGRRLPLAQSHFDLVLCNEVLEHLPDPQSALQELIRVARQYLILSVPREPHYRIANMLIGANWARWGDDADHRQRWTKSQFVSFLDRHLDVVNIKSPFPWLVVLCRVRV